MAKQSFRRLVNIARGEEKEAGLSGRLEHFTHFWFFVSKSFVQNRCLVRAAALSYTTLLALIPLLAIAIGVTSSLLKREGEQEIYHAIDKFISQVMPPATMSSTNIPPEALDASVTNSYASVTNTVAGPHHEGNERVTAQTVAAQRIHEFIHNTRSGTLGITGTVLLIFVAISMLNSIENTFNDIWGVQRPRSWLMRVARYWLAITLGPILIAAAFSLGGAANHLHAANALQSSRIGSFFLQIVTLVFVWYLFAAIYQFVPNTKVRFRAAMAGGIAAGTLWHLNNVFGFLYVSRVVSNSKMYGGLGLVPVFMAGLYLSWAILLLGAQIAYAFQNRNLYLQEKLVETVCHRDREILALRLMTSIGRRFKNGEKPAAVPELSTELEVPTKLSEQVLERLRSSQIITAISGRAGYVPARPLETITAHDILHAMRVDSEHELNPPDKPDYAEVLREFRKIELAECAASSPLTLLALVQQTQRKQ